MASYQLTKIQEYDGHGGPASEVMGGDNHPKTSTTPGRYVVGAIEKHVSYGKYKGWSGVAWGTEMRLLGDVVMVKKGGSWIRLSEVNSEWGKFKGKEKDLTAQIKKAYHSFYNKLVVPDRWVFNDFGHVSVKYFVDRNKNWKMDGKEGFLGDFIHTTPGDEARVALKQPIVLSESHGCIHVKPFDIDTLIGNGYIKKGHTIEVHPYSEMLVANNLVRNHARPPYEVHFYPGAFKIAVYRIVQK